MSPVDRFTCEEVFRRLDDFLDRELDEREAELVRQHLETCAQCALEHDFESRVLADVREKLRRIKAPPDLMEKVSRRLAKAREETGG